MIERNELLVAARAEFLRAYLDAFDYCLPLCIETAFKKADTSRSSLEQSHYLTVRGVLRERKAELREQLQHSMDKLLNRSLQTTYSTFRPTFAQAGREGELALVDTSTFEGELQLVAITDRFRNEAAEQLRDLNIRMALLFDQDDIKERENPFRPYLISRSLADASDTMGLPKELSPVLTQLLAESMEITVDGIYASVNALLARNGIAAELPLRIRKSPVQPIPAVSPEPDESVATPDTMAPVPSPAQSQSQTAAGSSISASPGSATTASGQSVQSVEQFLQSIKSMVDNAAQQSVAQSAANSSTPGNFPGISAGTSFAGGVQPAANNHPISAGTHEQKVDQLLSMVKRYSETATGFGRVSGAGMHAAMGLGAASTPQTMQQQAGSLASGSTAAPARAGWLSGVQKVGEVLRKFLGGGAVQGGNAGSSKNYVPPIAPRVLTVALAQSVDTLLHEHSPATADMLDSDGEVRNLILEQRSSLTEQTEEIDEQMTIDVVAMLFEFILRDTRVPAEVRAQLGRLQFLVLKLALRDPSFLTQKGHPARVLINRIGSISVGLKQIDPSSERVSAEICLIVETLLLDAAKTPDMFASLFVKLLDDFDEFVAAELRSKDKQLNRAAEAIENVQSRTLRYTHISAQMAEILSGVTLDVYLHDFLTNAWVQVIERAESIDMARARRYRALVPDLIWSIVPKIDEYDRQEMAVVLPVMIGTLREGLALIAWPEAQQKALLGWLFDAHTRALRSIVDEAFQVPSLPLMHTNFERLVENMPVEQVAFTPDVQMAAEKALMETMLRELNADIQSLDNHFDDIAEPEAKADETNVIDGSEHNPAALAEFDESIIERLHSGIIIEIHLSKIPSRARLSWISADAANLLLNLDDQHAPVHMSLRVFRRLVMSKRVRFIEDQPLFERAVQSLLDSAEQMDHSVNS